MHYSQKKKLGLQTVKFDERTFGERRLSSDEFKQAIRRPLFSPQGTIGQIYEKILDHGIDEGKREKIL